MQQVLVLNAGSSSLKWLVLDADSETVRQEGTASWAGAEPGRHEREILAALERVAAIDAIGHRVVHGGRRFQDAVLVDQRVRQSISELAELAPLHNPAALAGIEAAATRFPNVPQVAAFDTAFHADLPQAAAIYPLPWDWTERWGVRRFGFHGLSVQYALGRATQMLGCQPGRLVVCHLGAGCSITAVANGRSVDTSMGFTPLEGLMMARRSGSVDPGLLAYLLAHQGVSVSELDHALNEQSGLQGVSGVSADMREVLAAADQGNVRAALARDMFVHRVVSTIGAMTATLGGLDALVFTGGIGEHSAPIRTAVCARLDYLQPFELLVIPAREDLSILREVVRVLGWR
ncbi:MAG: acetate/propionate family kinase [Chloroflexi bacterium]|nr:acetate/propionate family kinase [Chloroflexota bacterium]